MVDGPKFTKEQRDQIAARQELIQFYRRTVDLLSSEQALFISHLLTSLGLDPEKQYSIGEDGVLIEADPDG